MSALGESIPEPYAYLPAASHTTTPSIDLFDRDEFPEIDAAVALGFQLVQLRVGDAHVAALFDLIAANEFVAFQWFVTDRTKAAIANARTALGVQLAQRLGWEPKPFKTR